MKSKRIANIVFYKFYDGKKIVTNACIFYRDGSIVNGSYNDGISACEELVKELNITSKDAFKEMINRDIVHVMSGKDFRNNFSNFVCSESVKDDVVETQKNQEATLDTTESMDDVVPVVAPIPTPVVETEEEEINEDTTSNENDETDEVVNDGSTEETEKKEEDSFDSSIEDEDLKNNEIAEKKPKKNGFFTKIGNFFKRPIRKLVACVTALAIGLGLYGCASRTTKEGKMTNSNLTSYTDLSGKTTGLGGKIPFVSDNNDYYDDYTFEQLLKVTNNKTQKTAMSSLGTAINGFNGDFAGSYVENGNQVRAALSFDEMVSLQQAYNDYSKNEIKAYFNGADIRADQLTRSYKDASLQLMGAHVMETRDNPVDMSSLLETKEGKDFYNKYHEMFLAAKEATDKADKEAKVSAFYKAVREDFPVTQEVRTEGIAHADAYATIESYKLSVTPMIAAAEMLYQNLDVDYTLNDSEIDFMNDIGLCNYAEKTFERIETIVLTSDEDNTNPLYEQYRQSIIESLKEKGQYFIDDEHRDLSKLQSFTKAVNWHFDIIGEEASYSESYGSQTYQTTSSYTKSATSYRTEETRTEKPIPASEKAKIDNEIAKENAAAKAEGEKKAAEKQQEIQATEDKKGEQIREEIKREEADLQAKIDEANKKIDENNKDNDKSNDTPVNESDFGDHNVHFDDKHSDSQGNLDDSVKDITTDSTGDQTNAPLPDPNVTGAEFDKQVSYVDPANDSGASYEYSGSVYEYNVPVNSYESAVDSYVENLASPSYESEDAYQYTLS